MECSHLLSICHGPLNVHHEKGAPILDLTLQRKRRLGRRNGHKVRTFARNTLPSSPGSSRRVLYQEPRRLLQTQDCKSTNTEALELAAQDDEPSTSGRGWTNSNCAADYTIKLITSNEDRSSLSIMNAGILLSLIGEGGEALVHRILPVQENAKSGLRFQRGAVDVVGFRGPNLGRIAALWIAPEAGTWRLEQVTVTIMPSQENATEDSNKKSIYHMFNAGDILLGDGEYFPAVELKPSQVLEFSGPEDPAFATLVAKTLVEEPKSLQESAILREASMREYKALKSFLLGSTAAMVGVGTLGLYLSGTQDLAKGFAVGGVAGLIYLLLIQRTVDQIPGPQNNQAETFFDPEKNGSADRERQALSKMKVKTPAAGFALIIGLALVVTRATQASAVISLPPQELLAGALGFFTSKIAVFLAAFSSPNSGEEPK